MPMKKVSPELTFISLPDSKITLKFDVSFMGEELRNFLKVMSSKSGIFEGDLKEG